MHPKTVLLVDDSEVSLAIGTQQLEEFGWTVTTRSQGIGTVVACLTSKPRCLVVDEAMASVKGSKIVDILRRTRPPISTKLVLHSALAEQELQKIAQACGADLAVRKGEHLGEALEKFA